MTGGELLFEIEQMIENFKETNPEKVELTYEGLTYPAIKMAVDKYRGRLQEPGGVTRHYWCYLRIGKITFKLIGEKAY